KIGGRGHHRRRRGTESTDRADARADSEYRIGSIVFQSFLVIVPDLRGPYWTLSYAYIRNEHTFMRTTLDRLAILLVEDHQPLAGAIAECLEELGGIVDYAASTNQARSLIGNNRYDLILLDVMLPGEDGYGFCHHLRHDLALDTP